VGKKIKPIVLDKRFSALNEKQQVIADTFLAEHQVLIGSAGTGKTYAAIHLALELILDKDSVYEKLIIVRAAEPTKSVGFLKGSLEDKLEIYELPYVAILNDITKPMPVSDSEVFGHNYEKAKHIGLVEFVSTSYLRGLTFDNAIILFDECQNSNFHELDSLFTRLGKDSKLVLCGDFAQSDLKVGQSGLAESMRIIRAMESPFNIIEFTTADIVRSGFVKDYLTTKEQIND